MQIVLLSGEIGSGKSTLCSYLEQRFGFHVLKTKLVMEQLALERSRKGIDPNRTAMQSFGQRLDRQTKGRWVETALTKLLRMIPNTSSGVVVDAVRIRDQIRIIRRAYGYSVAHVHLTASDVALAERYKRRTDSGLRELSKYSEVKKSKTEAAVHKLAEIADIVIDTELCTPEGVLVRAASHLNLYAGDHHRCVDVIVGGQFGSEGKGHVVSYLAREYQLLVRVGGPNAGHKVFLEPEPYTHHLLPSGTLRNPNASLILAPGCVLDVLQLMKEIAECNVDSRRLSIDPQAMIISPKDRQDEAKLVKKIGSTGQGVGFATARRITHRLSETSLAKNVKDLKPFVRETWPLLDQAYREGKKVMLEGTQGAGLSLYHGSYPYVTSRDTSVPACLSEAGIPPSRLRRVVMVCRTYPIRVQNPPGGTSGPIGREINWQVISERSGLPLDQLVKTEKTSTTHRDRRVAEFSWELLRRSSALNGPTDIALTFVDYLSADNERARRFEQLTPETIHFIEEVQRVAGAPVSLISTRFGFRSIIDRRAW